MRRYRFYLPLLFTLMLCTSVLAEESKIKVATIFDKRTVDINDEIKLTIRISGGQANILRPRIPQFEGFESYYTGRANQFTFINGRSESTTTFAYVLIPKRIGKFTLPPIEVEADNELFRTDPIQVEVLGAPSGTSPSGTGPSAPPSIPSSGPMPGPNPSGGTGNTGYQQPPFSGPSSPAPRTGSSLPPAPFGGNVPGSGPSPSSSSYPTVGSGAGTAPSSSIQKPNEQAVTYDTEREIFLSVTPDKLEAYPNEQIFVTYSVYTKLSARAEQFEKDPNLNGFWVEEIPIEKEYQPEKVIYGGLQYVKADVRRMALFPTTTGTFEIDPGIFRATVKKDSRPSSLFDEFFDESFFGGSFFSKREQKLLTAAPLKIVVRPLPEQGKPADFSGMVGQFQMSSTVDKRSIKQNEPIIMTLTLEGEGNVEVLERPKIPDLKDVKIYDSDSQVDMTKYRGGVRGRKTFEITFIPTQPGDYEIPALSFSYFDPRQQSYQTLKTSPYQVKVAPGPATGLPQLPARNDKTGGDLRKKIELESKDIRYIKESVSLNDSSNGLGTFIKLLGFGNGFLSLGAVVFFVRRKYEDKLDQNIGLKRSRLASRSAQKAIKALKKWSHGASDEHAKKFFEEAPKVLNAYFADKFNLSPLGLSFFEIEPQLAEKGMTAADLDSIRSFYETCDRVRFTSSGIPDADRQGFLKLIVNTMQFLEKK